MNVSPSAMSRHSTSFKALVIGMLAIVLWALLAVVDDLVRERAGRRDQVQTELGAIWGRKQVIGGAAIVVPLAPTLSAKPGETPRPAHVVILPDTLSIDVEVIPEVRRRSLFAVVLYRATAKMTGNFKRPSLTQTIVPADVLWDQAMLQIGVSDLRGVVSVDAATWGDRPVSLDARDHATLAGLAGPAPWDTATESVPFRVEMIIAGSSALEFLPAGRATDVSIRSPWPHPGFLGSALPATSAVRTDGFSASWRTSQFSRGYPAAWIDTAMDPDALRSRLAASQFGVSFVQPVDHYRQTERAVKYGFLFVLLTLIVFFLVEIVIGPRLHPIQYLLVGAALVVFFLLLLSVSEHVRFATAYALAAAVTIAAIVGYATRVLTNRRAVATVAVWLVLLYGVMYVLLSLEDMALLIGSVTVFVVLVAVMYLTRGVDWYGDGGAALKGA